MILLMLSLVARAGAPAADLSAGWYLSGTGRPDEAAAVAVQALASNPRDVDAHVLYAWVLSEQFQEGPAVARLYRDWHLAEPQDRLAGVMYAHTLLLNGMDTGNWCDVIEGLVDPLPVDTDLRLRAIRIEQGLRQICPGDPDQHLDELRRLAEQVPAAASLLLYRDLPAQPVDADVARRVHDLLDGGRKPSELAGLLWAKDAYGAGLDEARAAVSAAVEEAASSDEPDQVADAQAALWAMGDKDRAAALGARLAQLDPDRAAKHDTSEDPGRWMPRVPLPGSYLTWQALARTNNPWPAPRSTATMPAEEQRAPTNRNGQGIYESDVGDNLWVGLRRPAEVAARRAAWRTAPSAALANAYGYDAALAGVDMDRALAAVDQALAASRHAREDRAASGYEAWHRQVEQDQVSWRIPAAGSCSAWVAGERPGLRCAGRCGSTDNRPQASCTWAWWRRPWARTMMPCSTWRTASPWGAKTSGACACMPGPKRAGCCEPSTWPNHRGSMPGSRHTSRPLRRKPHRTVQGRGGLARRFPIWR